MENLFDILTAKESERERNGQFKIASYPAKYYSHIGSISSGVRTFSLTSKIYLPEQHVEQHVAFDRYRNVPA